MLTDRPPRIIPPATLYQVKFELQSHIAQTYLSEGRRLYYVGKLDGEWGPLSREAGARWFMELDPAEYASPFVGTVRALAAQFLLAEAGLYVARLDGLWGPKSIAAAEAWITQRDLADIAPDPRRDSLPYDVAKRYIGTREIPGKADNPVIVRWLRAVESWISHDEVPWCSAFVNHCAREARYESTGKLNARSWLDVGMPVALDDARRGDVVVLWRESRSSWKGHVAFLDHFQESRGLLYLLGGNQRDEVNISTYGIAQLLEVRRLFPLSQIERTAKTD